MALPSWRARQTSGYSLHRFDATFRWDNNVKTGAISARPSEIAFFDNSRKRLSNRAAVLMRCLLWKRGIRIPHLDGIDVTFVEETDERRA